MLSTVHRPTAETAPVTGPVLCRTCAVPMATDHSDGDGCATVRWHSCPVCRHRRMTCELDAHGAHGSASRDDDGAVVEAREVELH